MDSFGNIVLGLWSCPSRVCPKWIEIGITVTVCQVPGESRCSGSESEPKTMLHDFSIPKISRSPEQGVKTFARVAVCVCDRNAVTLVGHAKHDEASRHGAKAGTASRAQCLPVLVCLVDPVHMCDDSTRNENPSYAHPYPYLTC